MNQACVSLDEVLAAALVRAASLVPETSGYLALAVADATSRLPYAHDDRGVWLTVDGSVMVPRKPALTAPSEAARGLRDLLRRLLAASTGTMPGLASAARVRGEEVDVERVVGDVEAALIPVNRTAAKRALARLARETLRAKELGKLKKKGPPVVEKTAARVEKAAAPAIEKIAAPVIEKIAAPVIEKIAAPVAEKTAAPLMEKVPAPVVEKIAPHVAVDPPAPVIAAPMVVVAPPPMVVAPPPMVVAPPPSIVAEMARFEQISPAPPAIVAPPPMVASPAPVVPIAPPPSMEPLVIVMPDVVGHAASGADLAADPARAITPAPIEVEVEMSPEPSATAAAESGAIEWEGEDATIADPEAMAVIEASYREREMALDAPDMDAETVVPVESVVLPARDEDSFTQPWRGRSAEIASAKEGEGEALNTKSVAQESAPAKVVIAAIPKAKESAPEAITAEPALLSQLASSRADELIGAFRAEDEGDPALAAAASSLRAFAGVDEPTARRETQRPSYLRPPQVARKAPSLHDVDDDEELLPIPAPRSAKPAGSRWPFALFAVGVLVLFAAWLYRPTLAHDFFGLKKLVSPESTPPAAAPASTDDAAPRIDSMPAAASRPHDTHASSGSGDGARRRRD